MGITNDPDSPVHDLIALISEQSVAGECGNCGHNDWIGLSSPVSLSGEDQEFPCVGLACKTCGFIRLHSIAILKDHR